MHEKKVGGLHMDDALQFVVNRSVMMLIYKQPFLDWLCSHNPDASKNFTLEDLRFDTDTFLIPKFYDPYELVEWVEKRWRVLFESILFDWTTDESMWPKNRTLEMFREWFIMDIHSIAWDLVDEPLKIEDMGTDEEVNEDEPDSLIH